ncbi:MAG: hypothetical protein KC657_05985 [Myxococcales bacterium]|nr:hypothetical protein [Myxococcales bacterium]
MRGPISSSLTALVLGAFVACGYPGVDDLPSPGPSFSSKDGGGGVSEGDGATPATTPDASANETGPSVPDQDGDGVADDQDCDPVNANVGARLVQDDLSVARGHFSAADGFPAVSWEHSGNAYRQIRLDAGSDLSFFVRDGAVSNVSFEVTAASTEVSGAITPKLRQMFIVVGASSQQGQLLAHGCGVEVVEGETPEQKTSVVRLSGPTGAVTTTPLDRVARPALQANEEFGMRATLEGGKLTCVITQNGQTTTAQANVGALTGSVGMFTRQTKALFKNARVCKLK